MENWARNNELGRICLKHERNNFSDEIENSAEIIYAFTEPEKVNFGHLISRAHERNWWLFNWFWGYYENFIKPKNLSMATKRVLEIVNAEIFIATLFSLQSAHTKRNQTDKYLPAKFSQFSRLTPQS